jgi:hypothetical protein
MMLSVNGLTLWRMFLAYRKFKHRRQAGTKELKSE